MLFTLLVSVPPLLPVVWTRALERLCKLCSADVRGLLLCSQLQRAEEFGLAQGCEVLGGPRHILAQSTGSWEAMERGCKDRRGGEIGLALFSIAGQCLVRAGTQGKCFNLPTS